MPNRSLCHGKLQLFMTSQAPEIYSCQTHLYHYWILVNHGEDRVRLFPLVLVSSPEIAARLSDETVVEQEAGYVVTDNQNLPEKFFLLVANLVRKESFCADATHSSHRRCL